MEGSQKKAGFASYLGLTVLIGFGFLTMGLMDPLYDTYVPLFLKRYLSSNAGVGALMTMDNILQLALIPVVALWSDRIWTRIGRRMPFIVVMLPLSALLFTLIPPLASLSLAALIGIIFLFNIFKTSVRGPVVALMPDMVPAEYRSEANGIINMMGGLGLIISTLFLARFMGLSILPENTAPETLPFGIAGMCILAAVVILLVFVREKRQGNAVQEEKTPLPASLKQVFSGEQKTSVGRILIALFCWFLAYEGIKPFLGLYLVEYVGVDESSAALAQGAAGIASVILAFPSGALAHKLGRKRFIRICLAALTVILFLIPLSGFLAGTFSLGIRLAVFLAFMFLYGIFWIGVVVNSFPMLWQMADYSTMGIYTSLYYTFSQAAAILAPPLTGAVIDLSGYPGLFIFGAAAMLAAWFAMGGVKTGET